MIATISLSAGDRRDWIDACDAGLSPKEFIADLRLRELNKQVSAMNAVDAGLTADIDEDGDIRYQVTDVAKHYEFYKSSGFAGSAGITPDALAAHVAESALRSKQDRNALLEIGSLLRQSLLPEYPRLADVPFDINPSDHVNAWAQPVPAGGDAIIVNQQFTKCWVWCEWFIWRHLESADSLLYKTHLPDEELQLLRQSPTMQATRALAGALMGYRNSGNIVEQFAQELSRNGRNSPRGDLYAKMMATIAIAHEFGHVALGHTDWHRELINDIVREKPQRLSRFQLRAQQRKNEYAADEFAARALLGLSPKGTRVGLKFRNHALGHSAFMLFYLFQSAQSTGAGRLDDSDATHPEPAKRLVTFLSRMGIDELDNFKVSPLSLLFSTFRQAAIKLLKFFGMSRGTPKSLR